MVICVISWIKYCTVYSSSGKNHSRSFGPIFSNDIHRCAFITSRMVTLIFDLDPLKFPHENSPRSYNIHCICLVSNILKCTISLKCHKVTCRYNISDCNKHGMSQVGAQM
jgi:hypothetical protein